jgi:hypothetical protein
MSNTRIFRLVYGRDAAKILMKICSIVCANDKYTIVYTEEGEGWFSGRCLELLGAISQGETLKELERNMADAVQ